MRMFPQFRSWQGMHPAARHGLILAVFAVLLAGSALGGQLLGVFARNPCGSGNRVYTVVSGDTLSGIARRYNTTWWRLSSYNHLRNANLIFPYQTLCIPSQRTSIHDTHGSGSGSGVPRSQNQYVNLARQDAYNAGISADIFVRQIYEESGFNPWAVSPAGAIGIAQFEPETAAQLGVNPRDPVDALRGAARLMANYVWKYGGDYAKALAAYNAGPYEVWAAVELGGTYWRYYLPAETRSYLRIILG